MSCKLISLDTSTTSTGVAIWIDGHLEAVDNYHGKIDKSNKLDNMISQINNLLECQHPDIVVLELTAVARNEATQRTLTMLIGAVIGYCVTHDIFYTYYRPSEWRAKIQTDLRPTGRKRDDYKQWSKNVVKEKYHYDVNDDVADAILIGEAYINEFSL